MSNIDRGISPPLKTLIRDAIFVGTLVTAGCSPRTTQTSQEISQAADQSPIQQTMDAVFATVVNAVAETQTQLANPSETPTPNQIIIGDTAVPSKTSILIPTQTETPIPTATIEPTRPYPLPPEQVNPNYSIGSISLEEDFTIIIPQDTSTLSGYETGLTYIVSPLPITAQKWEDDPNVPVFEDYANNPYSPLALESNVAFHPILQGHTSSNFGRLLFLEWMRHAVIHHGEELVGKFVTLVQDRVDGHYEETLMFIDITIMTADEFNNADRAYPEKPTTPLFLDLAAMSIPEEASLPDQLTLIGCYGNGIMVNPLNPWEERIAGTLELVKP